MPAPAKKNRQRTQTIILASTLSVLLLGVALMAMTLSSGSPEPVEPPVEPIAKTATNPAEPIAKDQPAEGILNLVEDNGRTPWASPTSGEPLSLAYLPPGCELVLSLRLADLLDHAEGAKTLAAVGPGGLALFKQAKQLTGGSLKEVERLTVGVRGAKGQGVETTLIVEPTMPLSAEGDRWSVPAPARLGREASHNDFAYRIVGNWCYFVPPSDAGKRYVIASRPALHEILDAGGLAPPLRREMEQLVAASDADQQVALLVAPSFLFTEGKSLFAGDVQAMREVLFEELPDPLRSLLVSLSFTGDQLYWEVRAASSADMTAVRLAGTLDDRVARWQSELQLAVLDLNPAPYGRRLVAQLPLMIGTLAKYTRAGVDRGHALVNGYLPANAGPNLMLAGELMLAQLSAGGSAIPSIGSQPVTPIAQSAADKLQQTATVAFDRDTLEMAVRYLSDEINVPIKILGSDLQLEGITKNQSFGLNQTEKRAEAILLEILTRSNPDKTATGPADPKQKLVYVVKPSENEVETIYITTRAAAAKRGDNLPAVFEP